MNRFLQLCQLLILSVPYRITGNEDNSELHERLKNDDLLILKNPLKILPVSVPDEVYERCSFTIHYGDCESEERESAKLGEPLCITWACQNLGL